MDQAADLARSACGEPTCSPNVPVHVRLLCLRDYEEFCYAALKKSQLLAFAMLSRTGFGNWMTIQWCTMEE
jgi:hypothetical protein